MWLQVDVSCFMPMQCSTFHDHLRHSNLPPQPLQLTLMQLLHHPIMLKMPRARVCPCPALGLLVLLLVMILQHSHQQTMQLWDRCGHPLLSIARLGT